MNKKLTHKQRNNVLQSMAKLIASESDAILASIKQTLTVIMVKI